MFLAYRSAIKLTSWQKSLNKSRNGGTSDIPFTLSIFIIWILPILLIDEFIENKWAQLALIIFWFGYLITGINFKK